MYVEGKGDILLLGLFFIAKYSFMYHVSEVCKAVCICRANPVWLDPFCRNLELAAQADHEDDLPENLSEITDLWNSPARTHVSATRNLSSFVLHSNIPCENTHTAVQTHSYSICQEAGAS